AASLGFWISTGYEIELATDWRRAVVQRTMKRESLYGWAGWGDPGIKCRGVQHDRDKERWKPPYGVTIEMLPHGFGDCRVHGGTVRRLQAEGPGRQTGGKRGNRYGDHKHVPSWIRARRKLRDSQHGVKPSVAVSISRFGDRS